MDEDLWRRVAPLAILCIVLLLQIATRLLRQGGKMQLRESELRKEIKSIHREANALSGPSTFAQSAKMMRVAAKKEKELAQLREDAKQKKPFEAFMFVKAGTYCVLAWWFWTTPVATVPSTLLQPFAHVFSWTTKFSESSENFVRIGVLPWLLLSTRASSYITNFLFRKEKIHKLGGRRRRLWSWVALAALVAVLAMSVSPGLAIFNLRLPCPWPHNSQKLTGLVEDCQCDYQTVDTMNEEIVFPQLQSLVRQPFYRYFKVKLWCDCPFWPDDGMCHVRDCSVCECPENEFPETFKGRSGQLSPADPKCQEGKPQATVDRTLDKQAFHGWTEVDNPWTVDNETDNAEMTYVNLLLNPERYTGYIGESANRIWRTIYKMNCFEDADKDVCTERRILYKLISGLHSSISIHIAADYLLDESTNHWGPNFTLLHERVLQYPERMRNLYFVYSFVLRAVNKASDFLAQAEYNTGNAAEDAETQIAVRELVTNKRLMKLCPVPFDEAQLWKSVDATELKKQIQNHFRDISALMDCVGCEKCRLWGKLQTLGLGTALKILFSDDPSQQSLNLQRNEVIALINLLSRLAESLRYVNQSGGKIASS